MRAPLRLQASALLLAMLMPLAPAHAAEDDGDATEESLRQDIQSLDQALAESTGEQRDELMMDIEKVLGALDARITTLESRLQEEWTTADRLARAQAQTALASLRRERSRATGWQERMQDATEFNWKTMKESFDDAFDKVSESWQSAEQSVRKALEEN